MMKNWSGPFTVVRAEVLSLNHLQSDLAEGDLVNLKYHCRFCCKQTSFGIMANRSNAIQLQFPFEFLCNRMALFKQRAVIDYFASLLHQAIIVEDKGSIDVNIRKPFVHIVDESISFGFK